MPRLDALALSNRSLIISIELRPRVIENLLLVLVIHLLERCRRGFVQVTGTDAFAADFSDDRVGSQMSLAPERSPRWRGCALYCNRPKDQASPGRRQR